MPAQSSLQGDIFVNGALRARSMVIPDGTVDDDAVEDGADISATKLQHQHHIVYGQRTGSIVANQTEDVYILWGAGELVGVDVAASTAPTGDDQGFTVDVQKGNTSTGFTSVLASPIAYNTTQANRAVVSGTVTTPSLVSNDLLRVVVSTTGTSGTQGQGLLARLVIREDAD